MDRLLCYTQSSIFLVMKIVINNCYGGFGLSKEARDLLAILGFEHAIKHQKEYRSCEYDYVNFENELEFRTNELVISVIEKLKEEANGNFSKLQIIEIPDVSLTSIEIKSLDGKEYLIIDGVIYR